MDTIFSYELRREQPLSTEEKQRIRVILDAYRISKEQLDALQKKTVASNH